jgi:hypothetical protein
MSGASAGTANLVAAEMACGGGLSSVWVPDPGRSEAKLSLGVMVKFSSRVCSGLGEDLRESHFGKGE